MTKLSNKHFLVHPIFNASEFFIPTPMITELEKKIQSWLWNGSTGGIVLGRYRIGKTRAIQHISQHLQNRLMQNIPARCLTVKQRDIKTIASIFRNLCFALDLNPSAHRTSDYMANLLIHYFGELALSNDTRQVVLIVDEMQRLQLKQLEAFAELYDILSELKINFSVIFIGNVEAAKPLIATVMESENELLRGRFFMHSCSYYGLRTHEEIKQCLSAYDAQDPSGISITQKFLTKEYDNGFRMADLSHLIWDVYDQEYRQTLKLDSWGMQYFISMMKTLLIDYLPRYGVENEEDLRSMIDRSIDVSGLVPSLVEIL